MSTELKKFQQMTRSHFSHGGGRSRCDNCLPFEKVTEGFSPFFNSLPTTKLLRIWNVLFNIVLRNARVKNIHFFHGTIWWKENSRSKNIHMNLYVLVLLGIRVWEIIKAIALGLNEHRVNIISGREKKTRAELWKK